MAKSNTNKGNNHKGKGQNRGRSKDRTPSGKKDYDERNDHSDFNDDRNGNPVHNDPAWYTTSPQLTKDVGSIPFNWPIGTGVNFTPDTSAKAMFWRDKSVPGIMTMELLTGPGQSKGANSAVNIAARTLYEFVRHQNSGAKNYDPADLMMYLLAMDEAYSWYAHLVRAYGVAMLYNQKNRYYPMALLKALGFDANNIVANLPSLRYAINRFARAIGSLCVPRDITVFNRHVFCFANYFVDGDTAKAQTYAFVPYTIRVFDDTYTTGSSLSEVIYTKGGNTYNLKDAYRNENALLNIGVIRTICDTITDTLLGSEDVGIMGGDILKAYGKENLYTIDMIPEDMAVMPLVDPEICSQIMNATCWFDFYEYDITQNVDIDGGAIEFYPGAVWRGAHAADTPEDASSVIPACGNRLLNIYHEDPDPSEVIYMTRLTSTVTNDPEIKSVDGQSLGAYLYAFGTEIAGRCHVWTSDVENGNIVNFSNVSLHMFNSDFGTPNNELRFERLATFNYHPTMWFTVYSDSTAENPTANAVIQQIENYAMIESEVLYRIHDAAILSMWRVPQIGLYNG
jgi:hypothetical protein